MPPGLTQLRPLNAYNHTLTCGNGRSPRRTYSKALSDCPRKSIGLSCFCRDPTTRSSLKETVRKLTHSSSTVSIIICISRRNVKYKCLPPSYGRSPMRLGKRFPNAALGSRLEEDCRKQKPPLVLRHRMRKGQGGCFRKPFSYLCLMTILHLASST